MLDQKPQLFFTLLIRAHKVPDALKFLALQLKFEPAFFKQLYRITDGFPHATVPDDDIARAIVAFRNIPFESSVIQRMVFHLYSQTFDVRVQARPFRHRPAFEGALQFEAKVIMQMAGIMLLDTELQGLPRGLFLDSAGRLRRRRKIALLLVVVQSVSHTQSSRGKRVRVTTGQEFLLFQDWCKR